MFGDTYSLADHWLDRFADPTGEKRRMNALAAARARAFIQQGLLAADTQESCRQLIQGLRCCTSDAAPMQVGLRLLEQAVETLQDKRHQLLHRKSGEAAARIAELIGWDRAIEDYVNTRQELAKTVHVM